MEEGYCVQMSWEREDLPEPEGPHVNTTVLWFRDCALRRARVSASGRIFGDIVDLSRYGIWRCIEDEEEHDIAEE